MLASVTTRMLGDRTRTVARVTDDKGISASAVVDGHDRDAALDNLEALLVAALDAVRKERLRADSEAA